MPNKNGFQVLEEAKADQNTKNIAIVIFPISIRTKTGYEQKLGAVDFWVKSDMAINDVVGKINKSYST